MATMFATVPRGRRLTHRERLALDALTSATTESVEAAKAETAAERARVTAATGLHFDERGRVVRRAAPSSCSPH
jgi:hypothetical protein